jgi:hypothetical protein
MKTRRQILTYGFRGSFLAGCSAFGYGSLYERKHADIERVDVPLPERHRGLDGLAIGFLTDFHHDEFQNNQLMGGAIDQLNALNPDLVMLGGDYISDDLAGLDSLTPHLARLKSTFGTYGVLGNHDQWTDTFGTTRRLENDGGITVLNNAHRRLEFGGTEFAVGGVESIWGGTPDLAAMADGLEREVPLLFGWHEPDPFDSLMRSPVQDQVVLQVSGHTHGGQVRAPLYGAIKKVRYGQNYVAGLFQDPSERASLYVNRGIGSMGLPVRFLCPPEITLLTLRASPVG